MKIKWPDNKKFAFTIVDDTENSAVENVKPIFDFLYKNGMLTTKTVWVYPLRDGFTGECLLDNDYLKFIADLKQRDMKLGCTM